MATITHRCTNRKNREKKERGKLTPIPSPPIDHTSLFPPRWRLPLAMMVNGGVRAREGTSGKGIGGRGDVAAAKFVKRELVERAREGMCGDGDGGNGAGADGDESGVQGTMERRTIRSQYLEVKNLICDERDNISKVDSSGFATVYNKMESLHKYVQKPREQVADAEALLDITSTLMTIVKSHSNEGVTPSDFVTALVNNFGQQGSVTRRQDGYHIISWANLGLGVSHIFRNAPGCCTMLGPMITELKQRMSVRPRKRRNPFGASIHPEEVKENEEKRVDTEKNVSTMFEVLKKHRSARFEHLVLNRKSFAQTVENIFAFSFLVKDGRCEIKVKDKGYHMISPRNAPAAAAVTSGEVSFSHFVLRFDYTDWELMLDTITPGDELMPHRIASNIASGSNQAEMTCNNSQLLAGTMPSQASGSQADKIVGNSQSIAPATAIRKFTLNQGLVIQEQTLGESPDSGDCESTDHSKRKTRRLFRA